MVTPGALIKASFNASKAFFRMPVVSYDQTVMVPIRSIGPRHGERIAAHLLALDAPDRYLRFGQ
jgi:hypothetical protein